MKYNTKIETYSGLSFDYADIPNNKVNIDDIAWALSGQLRFMGHLPFSYSVAEHCIYVSKICKPEHALHGLLHDASEAYMIDLAAPLKHMPGLHGYRELEEQVHKLIFNNWGLDYPPMPDDVVLADKLALIMEFKTFRGEFNKDVWSGWMTEEMYEATEKLPPLMIYEDRETVCCEYGFRFAQLLEERVKCLKTI